MAKKNNNGTRSTVFQSSTKGSESAESAKDAIKQVLPLAITDELKRLLLYHLIWRITVADGKYSLRYCSEGALKNLALGEKVEHEHVYQIKWLQDELMKPQADIDGILKKAIPCLVTANEHTRMKPKTIGKSMVGWGRYESAGCKVYDMSFTPPKLVDFNRPSL